MICGHQQEGYDYSCDREAGHEALGTPHGNAAVEDEIAPGVFAVIGVEWAAADAE